MNAGWAYDPDDPAGRVRPTAPSFPFFQIVHGAGHMFFENRVERGVLREAKCDKNAIRSSANGALAWREITRGWRNRFLNIPAQIDLFSLVVRQPREDTKVNSQFGLIIGATPLEEGAVFAVLVRQSGGKVLAVRRKPDGRHPIKPRLE